MSQPSYLELSHLLEVNKLEKKKILKEASRDIKKRKHISKTTVNERQQIEIIDNINQSLYRNTWSKSLLKREHRGFLHLPGSDGRCVLHVAAEIGNLEFVVYILDKVKLDPNFIDGSGKPYSFIPTFSSYTKRRNLGVLLKTSFYNFYLLSKSLHKFLFLVKKR